MSIRLLVCSLVAGLGVSACASLPFSHGPHWSYAGKEGPEHWGSLSKDFALCSSGKNQSPVDLGAARHTRGGKLSFQHAVLPYTVENNGHTIQAVPGEEREALTLGERRFALKQFHFHVPSEHTFRTKFYPMEIHFVHQSQAGELAVLAVTVKEGAENPSLQPLLASPLKAGESVALADVLDIGPLFPSRRAHYRLNGSLTTPPCSEGVNWIVFTSPIQASKAQIARMAELIGQANNRPVQPINARVVVEES